jgi:hypothetical protein
LVLVEWLWMIARPGEGIRKSGVVAWKYDSSFFDPNDPYLCFAGCYD